MCLFKRRYIFERHLPVGGRYETGDISNISQPTGIKFIFLI